jgi:hypothetical protein
MAMRTANSLWTATGEEDQIEVGARIEGARHRFHRL